MLQDFKKLMIARFFFTFAVQMQAVVIGWRMYELTHDPLFLGLIGLAEAVPAIGFSLPAGYIVDHSRPLRVYRNVILGSLVSAAVLLGSQIPKLAQDHGMQVTALFVASFLTGSARSFSQPAVFAVVPRLVPRGELSKASAWTTVAMQIARIAGPAFGGLVFGFWGTEVAATLVCLFLVFSISGMALIPTIIDPLPRAAVARSRRHELLSGLTYVYKHPILLPALSLDMISVLFGGVTALLPIFAAEILFVGARGLGMLRAAPAIGAALTSFWFTRRDLRENAGTWLFIAVGGFGACVLAFGFSRSFGFSLFALGLSGAFDSVSMIIRGTAVQLSSPNAMRGRISAVNSIFIGSSNEIGEFESGVAARFLGTVPAVIFGGVMCLFTVAVVGMVSPKLRKLDLRAIEVLE